MRSKYLLFTLALSFGFVFLLLWQSNTAVNAEFNQLPAENTEDFIYSQWQTAPNSPFAYTRFDAEYSTSTGLIYFLGGRLADGGTDGSVWSFDPATGTYTDTGVDLTTPVSNYIIARVMDDTATEVLMIFGGRPTAGGVTNVVQGYIPSSNTAVTYPSDPFPISTAPGGLAVHNNLVYVFGGFDGANITGDTYIYDPTDLAGQRWSNGPALTLARSYLATAVVDDYIYAIGGDTFDGTALIPQVKVERLDTTNPTAWDDAGVADLPLACDETHAFGFDSTAAYDLAGAIVVAGCGQWPEELPEGLLYDVANDSWDVAFPDLNLARRNHAGAFVPNGAGIDGQPGIWVWGGRQVDDATVLSTPEFYSVTPLGQFTLIPRYQYMSGTGTVQVNAGASNRSGANDTFNMTYSGSLAWNITGPATVAVNDGEITAFTIGVEIPSSADCADINTVTIDAVGQTNNALVDSVTFDVQLSCLPGVEGIISDANSSQPIENAVVIIEDVTNPDNYHETLTDADGYYSIIDVPVGDYYLASSAQGYQFSILPSGWPTGAISINIQPATVVSQDVVLNAPIMEWSETGYTETLNAGEQVTRTLVITNTGTSDLYFSLGTYNDGITPPPPAWVPNERIDPRILEELNRAESGETDFLVFMNGQADLSAAYGITDWNARGQYVYDMLQATAVQSQFSIRHWLDNANVPYRSFVASNSILVQSGSLDTVQTLANRADVAYLLANDEVALQTTTAPFWQIAQDASKRLLSPTALEWGVLAVNADDVWSEGLSTGENIVVANIDTGVEWSHPALVNQYRGGSGDHDYNWYMPTSGCAGQTQPCDNNGHGTHTMGSIVGSDNPSDPLNATNGIGVAPSSSWIACKGCEANGCSFEALLACGDWMVAPTDLNGQNADPSKRPHIVNNSWGGGGGDFWYGGVVGAWRASGMFPQFSAGNSGPSCSTTGAPGDYISSYAAGALDSSLNIAGFSSRGPAAVTGILKPNISAPGANVRSSVPGNGYANFNGTSMASPHVAGVAALLWSVKPELIGQIDDTMWLLSQTANPLYTAQACGGDTPSSHPNNTFGWGVVDAYAAVTDNTDIVVSWVETLPGGGTVAPGQSISIDIRFTAPLVGGVYTGTLQLTADEPYNREVLLPLSLTVEGSAEPIEASFDHNGPIELGETAVFTNTSTGIAPISYLWDFGDGQTSTDEHPTHLYAATGTYTVTLTATDTTGTSTATAVFVVNEVGGPASYNIYLPILLKNE